MTPPMIDPALFEQLKSKIEEDASVRKELDQILDDLNQHVSFTQGVLSRIHSTPRSKCLFSCFHDPRGHIYRLSYRSRLRF